MDANKTTMNKQNSFLGKILDIFDNFQGRRQEIYWSVSQILETLSAENTSSTSIFHTDPIV